jgi:TolB-like protein/Tfp pilus assembly protein PilF
VLPFADLSQAGDQQYFADGLSEEIINGLTRVRGLRVAARTSAFSFRDPERDVRAVGTALGVGSILEGSVRRAGDRARISATLVDARDGFHLWSGSFDRRVSDVFAIQEEIAEKVVAAIRGEVGAEPVRRVPAARAPADFRAYELYLRGLSLTSRRGDPAAMDAAAARFEEALRIDPHYAPAHAGLAEARFASWQYLPPLARDPPRSLDRALESATRALQLDPELAHGHAVLGVILAFRADWSGASAAFERALDLDPGSARARHWRSWMLMARGEREQALDEVQLALRLDPLSGVVNWQLGNFLLLAGRPEEAIPRLLRSLELNPHNVFARWNLAWAHAAVGRERAAVEAVLPLVAAPLRPIFRIANRLFGLEFGLRTFYALAAWRSGEPCLPDPYLGATFRAALGDRDETFSCLERSIDAGRSYVLKVDPIFDPYRDDPRFDALLARVGLAD